MKKHLNLTILIAIGVLAVLVVGYCYYQLQVEQKAFNWQKFAFVHKSTTVDTSDWLTYRNEQYGFEFKYPKEWKLFTKINNGYSHIGFSYNKITQGEEPIDNMVPAVVDIVPLSYITSNVNKIITDKIIDGRRIVIYSFIGMGDIEVTSKATQLKGDDYLIIGDGNGYIEKTLTFFK